MTTHALTIEDEDGQTIVSDDLTHTYGTGATLLDALADYAANLAAWCALQQATPKDET